VVDGAEIQAGVERGLAELVSRGVAAWALRRWQAEGAASEPDAHRRSPGQTAQALAVLLANLIGAAQPNPRGARPRASGNNTKMPAEGQESEAAHA
jgi:hypothetical protein